MQTRRQLIQAVGAAAGVAGLPGLRGALASDLAGQPPLPGPLGGYLGLPLDGAEGRATTLGALLGPPRPTVVSFWATWCAPCALEGQRLAALRSEIPEPRLAIIGVNVDNAADPVKLAMFRQKARMNYLQGLAGQRLYAAMTGASQTALPRLYVFDAQGGPTAAFGRFFGGRSLAALEAAVRRVAA